MIGSRRRRRCRWSASFWHGDFWGCSTPIHEGNTIGRAVAVGGFLVMRVGMIFWWLRATRQDQLGVRRARPMRSSPPWRRSAGSRCCSSRGSAFRGRLACHLILADRQPGQNVASAVTLRTFRICRRGGNSGLCRRAPNLHYCTGQGGTEILRGSAKPRIMAHDPISAASTQPMNAPSRDAKQIAWGDVGARG
jgi:hypothetical protein